MFEFKIGRLPLLKGVRGIIIFENIFFQNPSEIPLAPFQGGIESIAPLLFKSKFTFLKVDFCRSKIIV